MKAGIRAPEDYSLLPHPNDQDKNKDETKQKERELRAKQNVERAQRIVANDLENIPLGLVVIFASVFVLFVMQNKDETTHLFHCIFVIGFTVGRILHTVFFLLRNSFFRTISFALSLTCLAGVLVNALMVLTEHSLF